MKGTIFYVPLEKAVTPAEGHCYVDRWWAVDPQFGVAFYLGAEAYDPEVGPRPQCNVNKRMVESLIRRMYPQCEAVFLVAVFEGQARKIVPRVLEARKAAQLVR